VLKKPNILFLLNQSIKHCNRRKKID